MVSKPLFVDIIDASLNTQPYARHLENLASSNALHLDIGAGVGQNVSYVESLGLRSVALEYDPDYLSKIPINKIARATADHLPFRSDCFDVVSLIHVLEHLPAYKQTLREIHRVIKPNGYFIVEVPNKYSLQELFNLFYTKYFLDQSNKHLGHCNFFYYASLKVLLEEYQFEIIDVRITKGLFSSTFHTIWVNLLRLSRMLMKHRFLDANDYEYIQKNQDRLQWDLLNKIDQKINHLTYRFVEFFGFVCIAKK